MELIVVLVALTTGIFNLVVINRFKGFQVKEYELLETILENTKTDYNYIPELSPPLVEEELVKVSPVTDDKDNDKYNAWKNVTYEPIPAPASPHGPPPVSGPLARPYGFSR